MSFSRVVFLIASISLVDGCTLPKNEVSGLVPEPSAKVATAPGTGVLDVDAATKEADISPDSPSDDATTQTHRGCRTAVQAAESAKGLPEGLLSAIAGVESGMHSNALRIAGRSVYPETKQQAKLAAKRALDRSQSVMAGCMQVNLQVHDPRGELWALEPQHAADWAADYLNDLHNRLGSWRSAISVYGGDSGRTYVRRIERHLDDALPDEVAEAP